MKNRNQKWQAWLAATLLAGVTSTAMADRSDGVRYADELESCVQAIKAEIDLDGVHRIRYVVTNSTAQGIAYELTLKTSTYAGDSEKNYSAYCLVTGKRSPSRLRIEEKST